MSPLCYIGDMDTTIRNLDARTYRKFKARAAAEGKTVGALMNEAMEGYLALPQFTKKHGSLFDVKPFDFGPGSEHLSEQVDEFLYGDKS